MTRDDIIRMAREAGGVTGGHDTMIPDLACIERFAALVAAAEREECAKVAEDSDHIVDVPSHYAQLGDTQATARNIAAAIRARGQT